MKLSAEQIQSNWEEFHSNIIKYIKGDRQTQLLVFYTKFQERLILMPAAHKKEYHNSYHYFAEMNKEGKYLGEDMSFFHRVSDIGYDVWMDTSIELQHIGSHVFGK